MDRFLFLLFVFSSAELFALSNGEVFSPEFEKDLKAYVEASMKCHHIPGMTLSVVKGNEVWTGGFGMEDISSGKPADADSKFNIGSVTKAFTATLLGVLLSEKGLDWSAKVTSILGPGYEFVDPYRTKELTLKDLLSHRTGLARLDFGAACGIPKSVSRSSFCKSLKYLPEENPVRDSFLYSNYMYLMLGHVTEVLGGDTWENLMTSKIFQPIGMNSTTFILTPTDVLGPNMARPYIYKDGEYQNGTLEVYDLNPIGSDGGILVSATDMAKWIKFNLNLGKTESGVQLLDKKRMEEMRHVTTPLDQWYTTMTRPMYPVHDVTKGYGYAWFISEYRGFKNIRHSGGMVSYITRLWTFPDMNVGIFGSVNGPGIGRPSANHLSVSLYYIADYLLGLKPWLNETTACTFPSPWENKTHPEAYAKEIPFLGSNLTDYEGTFGHHIFPDIDVYANISNLVFNSTHLSGFLYQSSEKDRFLSEISYPWEYSSRGQLTNVTFQRDTTGTVNEMTLHLEVDLTYVRGLSVLDTQSGP